MSAIPVIGIPLKLLKPLVMFLLTLKLNFIESFKRAPNTLGNKETVVVIRPEVYLSSGIHLLDRVANGYGTHDLSMAERAKVSSTVRNAYKHINSAGETHTAGRQITLHKELNSKV